MLFLCEERKNRVNITHSRTLSVCKIYTVMRLFDFILLLKFLNSTGAIDNLLFLGIKRVTG